MVNEYMSFSYIILCNKLHQLHGYILLTVECHNSIKLINPSFNRDKSITAS